jgi:hypothetical protein
MKVFLGGTCNGSGWRQQLIPLLTCDYFDPVVDDWTAEAAQEELFQRHDSDIILYVITPKMKGVYSIAEAVDDSHRRLHRVVFCVLDDDQGIKWDKPQRKSMDAVVAMMKRNGVATYNDLELVAAHINAKVDFL